MSVTGAPPEMLEMPNTMDWALIVVAALLLLAAFFFFVARGRASAEARAGLALGVRGLLGKEIRSRNRGWRPVFLLTAYLGLLALAVIGFLRLMGMAYGTVSPTMGTQLFSTLGIGAVLLLAFITPALTTGAISGERERRTLDLLMVTRSSPLGLAVGKLLGSLSYVLFLLVASLPAFALVYLFGGVPAIYIIMILAVAAFTALAHASLGLLLSALLRRTLVATVVAYVIVLFVIFGLPVISLIAMIANQRAGQFGLQVPPLYVYASPLTSVASVLPTGPSGMGVPLIGDLPRALMMGSSYLYGIPTPASPGIAHAVYVVGFNATTGEPQMVTQLAPWVYYFAFSALFAVFCVAITALLLAPVKPWQHRRRVISND